jgi:ubiquinone/menaquinone biosynthesis C-methylase UbiE
VTATTHGYDRSAARYLEFWAPVLEPSALALLDRVAVELDGRAPSAILDVGTGTGVLARSLVGRWPEARVTGVDASRAMLEVADGESRRALATIDLERLDWRTGLAESLPFGDAAFDLVVSSFVYQLVPDRSRALEEALRVLRPGGRLAFVTWLDRGDDFAPQLAFDDIVEEERLDEDLPEEEARAGDPESPEALVEELAAAGFAEARATEEPLTYAWTRESYFDFLVRYDAAEIFESLSLSERRRIRGLTVERLAALPAEAFTYRTPVVMAFARRP